jgi:P-type E1-E2 ATPase
MVVLGQGTAIVCCVGMNTQTGEVEEKLFEDDEEGTPLQQKLETVADFIGKVGLYVAGLTFVAMTLNIVISRVLTNQQIWSLDTANGLINAVIIAITIVVVAVPEGLPLAVTLSLAYSVNQMRKENNLVRRLEAAETMGGANEICTDKTGTLTQNRMTIVEFFSEGQQHQTIETISVDTQQLILEGCALNNKSYIIIDEKTGEEKRIGNQTECSMLDFINRSLKKIQSDVKHYDTIKSQHKIL